MLDLSAGLINANTSLLNPWDNRTPWQLQCIGPAEPNKGIGQRPHVWTGAVHSAGTPVNTASTTGVYVVLSNGLHNYIWEHFPQDEDIKHVSVAFDVNGRLVAAYQSTDDECFYIYYHDGNSEWTTAQLEAGARTPVVALDRFNGAFGNRDVTVCYLVDTGTDNELRIRYQRERYETVHLVQGGLRSTDMLRTAGTTHEGRFTWRFRRAVKLE